MREIRIRCCSLAAVFAAACSSQTQTGVADPIDGIPIAQQRTIDRGELGLRWPLSVGRGTLGCASGAIVFRSAGTSYALNDAARARGFASVDPIWHVQSGGPPTNPLGRIRQDERERIFRESSGCGEQGGRGQSVETCRRDVREKHRLTDAELKQVEAEGRERLWPPLSPRRADLGPVIETGLKLCRAGN